MDIKSLNYFVEAAKALNFTKAAKNCNVTQTAISISIAKMEEELGFTLFKRNNRSMHLTQAGREFYNWASQTLNSYQKIISTGRHIANGDIGALKIGICSSFEGLWFRKYIEDYQRQFPRVKIEFKILHPNELKDALKNREVDAFLGILYDFIDDADVSVEILFSSPMCLFMNPENPLTTYSEVPTEVLTKYDSYILPFHNTEFSDSYFSRMMAEKNIHFHSIEHVNFVEEMFLNISGNNTVAFLPEFVKDHDPNNILETRRIQGCDTQIPFSFCYKSGSNHPVINSLIYLFHQKQRSSKTEA